MSMRRAGPVVALVLAIAAPGAAHAASPSAGDPLAQPRAFASPPNSQRPKFRWWWGDPPFDQKEFTAEVDAFSGAGFGGAEAAFGQALGGGTGWATPEQRQMLAASLQEAQHNGTRLDMTIGAAWPITTPNTKPGSGLSEQELMYGRRDLAGPSVYVGAPPHALDDPTGQQNGGKLIAVTAARVTSAGDPVVQAGTPPQHSTVLDPGSLVDLTSSVDAAGNLTWNVPAGQWILFGIWQRDASEGVMDHLSAASLNAVTDYVDKNQLGAQVSPLLPAAAQHFFEDSLELDAHELWWTWRFAQEFNQRRGYDVTKYLPLLFIQGQDHYWVPDKQPPPDFDLPNGIGDRIRHDYYETLTDLYIDYHIAGFARWARTHGMTYRSQVAYGDAFDVTRSARAIDRLGGIADDESLNAGDNPPLTLDGPNWRFALDHYRTVVGGAHQAGQDLVSSELGAVFLRDRETNLSDYKAIMDKQWAAGLTRPIVHGYAYQAPGSPWPGADHFSGIVADSWNFRTYPQWSMWRPLTDYWARGSMVLEHGKPREDVAIYRDGFVTTAATTVGIATNAGVYQVDPENPLPLFTSPIGDQAIHTTDPRPTPFFNGEPLERAGYTFEYLDPAGVREPQAVGNGVLYPSGPAYRALVIDQRALPGATADALASEAAKGLAVVFVGSPPDRGTGFADSAAEDSRVSADVQRILAAPRTRRVATQADVLGALRQLGVEPGASWSRPLPVYSQHRQQRGVDYWYLWNAGAAPLRFSASFAATGAPYLLDLWTGRIAPEPVYRARGSRTTVPISLQPGETTVLAFRRARATRSHAVSSDAEDTVVRGAQIELRDTRPGTRTVRFSDGSRRQVSLPRLPGALAPRGWHLHVDDVGPSGTTAHELDLTQLQDWRDISAISGASGAGTYTTTIALPSGWVGRGRGTYLDLGTVDGAMQVFVDGRPAAPDVVPDRRFDVSGLLHPGANELKVVVTTTLKNRLVAQCRSGDLSQGLLCAQPATQAYGLLGPVRLIPYARAAVALPRAPRRQVPRRPRHPRHPPHDTQFTG
jgi:hypothetical protein